MEKEPETLDEAVETLNKQIGEYKENQLKKAKEFMDKFSDILEKYKATMKIEDGKIVFSSMKFGKVEIQKPKD